VTESTGARERRAAWSELHRFRTESDYTVGTVDIAADRRHARYLSWYDIYLRRKAPGTTSSY
jgi:hypothetical protein